MKTYIVGNWKMHFTVGEASVFLHKIMDKVHASRDLAIAVAPSMIALQPLSLQIDRRKIKLAAQNIYHRDFGPYTGETAVSQLRGIVDYCLVGHSERRYIFHENDKEIRAKVAACVRNGIIPILCVGETETERTFRETKDIIHDQLVGGLADVAVEDMSKVVIAYEPIWATSSTKDAKIAMPDDVADTVSLIRNLLKSTYGARTANKIPILYGGSVSPSNAAAYLTIPEVNGLMIGNSSLTLSQFTDIIEIAKKVK